MDINWVVASSLEQAYERASKKLGIPKEKLNLEQDDDVLDTWFSSGNVEIKFCTTRKGIYPFSTFDWPNSDSSEYNGLYPTHLLETGHDILFFWVARMVKRICE